MAKYATNYKMPKWVECDSYLILNTKKYKAGQ